MRFAVCSFDTVEVWGSQVPVPTILYFMHLHGITSRSRGYKRVPKGTKRAGGPYSCKIRSKPHFSASLRPSRGLRSGPGNLWQEQTDHGVLCATFRGRNRLRVMVHGHSDRGMY